VQTRLGGRPSGHSEFFPPSRAFHWEVQHDGDLIERIRKLENEVKLLKNEIQNTLLNIRDSLTYRSRPLPSTPPAETARPQDGSKAKPQGEVPQVDGQEVPAEHPQTAQARRLRFHKVRQAEGAKAPMVAQFLDDDDNPYEWAPTWNQVERLFLHSIDVEQPKESESNALDVLTGTAGRDQRVENSDTLKGYFEYDNRKLVLSLWGDKGEERLMPALYIASGFFDKWLESDAEDFVTKGYTVHVTRLDDNGRIIEVYPPRNSQ